MNLLQDVIKVFENYSFQTYSKDLKFNIRSRKMNFCIKKEEVHLKSNDSNGVSKNEKV